ncbi:MAG: maltose alpha-D-glucosyltransferase [Gammaproteobacteria bacterium]|nr:maltose alpha-D-glucosyltransferase [Gammaproteobacteria bacterium]
MNKYINWLEEQSLLASAKELAKQLSGTKNGWQQPYALPQTEQALEAASVWFNAYPAATIIKPGQNILQFLGDADLWQAFAGIGIQAVHTSPMKLAGGLVEDKHTPTVDGWFDRIALTIDPAFGSESDYAAMVDAAAKQQAIIAGDIIPGHTGKGADFLLALRNYGEYPGIYDLIEIAEPDWALLPEVENEWESVNLSKETVNLLHAKGYLPGNLQRVLFSIPETEDQVTGWDVTGKIEGVDGVVRRWIYLHYFKPGLPTMNWLDPTFAAKRIIAGDIIKSIRVLKNKIVRFDATPFLGIEPNPDPTSKIAWSEGHPLSVTSTENLAWFVRKLGGWSFQELNLSLDIIKTFSQYGPDLAYDFITRPAVQHAMLTKDATFLHFMFKLMQEYAINPRTLIHGMQNHDEITYELVHFLEHSEDQFDYAGETISGKELRDQIRAEMFEIAIGPKTPYNDLTSNGLCTTLTGLIATRLQITDIYNLSLEQKEQIKQAHLLLVLFNAMQPGVFVISGWDLVGALPAPREKISHLLGDKDYRWINRGAYDLLDSNAEAETSTDGLPRVENLYGSLQEQLKDSASFVSQLKNILAVRKQYKIDLAEQIAIPEVANRGAVIMLHKLPENSGYEITALNFGDEVVVEKIDLSRLTGNDCSNRTVVDLLQNVKHGSVNAEGIVQIELKPLEGKVLLVS